MDVNFEKFVLPQYFGMFTLLFAALLSLYNGLSTLVFVSALHIYIVENWLKIDVEVSAKIVA